MKELFDDSILLDVDKIAKELYCKKSEILGDLRACFGNEIFCLDGMVDYRTLANKVFSSEKELKKLNDLMFRPIEQKVENLIDINKDKKCIIIDAAILFETKLYKLCDYIIWVRADKNRRKKFLRKKSDLTDDEIKIRLEGQNIKIKRKLVNFIIDNNGSKRNLRRQVEQIVQEIQATQAAV